MQKMATIIVMQDIFSDHTNQYVEVWTLALEVGCIAHE